MATQKSLSARSKKSALSDAEKLRIADEKWVAWTKKTWGDAFGDSVAARVRTARQSEQAQTLGAGRSLAIGEPNVDGLYWELSAGLLFSQANQLEKEDAWRRQNLICQKAHALLGGDPHQDQGEAGAGVIAALKGALEPWAEESTRWAPRAQIAWVAKEELRVAMWHGIANKRWGEGAWIWRPVAGAAVPFLASAGADGEAGIYPQEAWAAAAEIYGWADALFTQAHPAGHWRVLSELPAAEKASRAAVAKNGGWRNLRAIAAGASAVLSALKSSGKGKKEAKGKSIASAWRSSRLDAQMRHKKAVAQEKHKAASLELAQIWAAHRAIAQKANAEAAAAPNASTATAMEKDTEASAAMAAAVANPVIAPEPNIQTGATQKREGAVSRLMGRLIALGSLAKSWATPGARRGQASLASLATPGEQAKTEEELAARALALAAAEQRALADAMLFWEHEPAESRRTAPEWILGPRADQEFSVGVAFAKALNKPISWESESVGLMERKFASPGLPGSVKALSAWMKIDAFAKAASEAQALKRALVGSSRSSGLKGALMACALMERTGWTDEARKAVASRPRSKEGVIAARAAEEFTKHQRATAQRWWADERGVGGSPQEERFAAFLQELADTHVACFEQQRLREVIEAAKKPFSKRRKKKTGEDGADSVSDAESANHEGDKSQASAQPVAEAGYGEGSEDEALWATESEPTQPEPDAQPMEPPPVRKARRL